MIEKLTPEQTARFPEFADKWIKIGLSTEPADRPRAEAAIRLMYEAGGLLPPEKIVWFDSPSAMFAEYGKTGGKSIGDVIWDTIHSAASRALNGTIHNDVQRSARDNIRDAVTSAVWSAVWNTIWIASENAALNTVRDAIYGSHEAQWLCQYDFHREVLGLVEETNKLAGVFELAKSCGWLRLCKRICFASERHSVLNRDHEGKLHCENGPAVSYPDGWSIYADHGVRVSEKVVMDPGGFTLQELKKLKMHEVEIVLRKIGVEKFMSIHGTTSDTWTDLFNEIAEEIIND